MAGWCPRTPFKVFLAKGVRRSKYSAVRDQRRLRCQIKRTCFDTDARRHAKAAARRYYCWPCVGTTRTTNGRHARNHVTSTRQKGVAAVDKV